MQLLSSMPPNQTLLQTNVTVGEVTRDLNKALNYLSRINGTDIGRAIEETGRILSQLSQAVKYLRYAGIMHLEMANRIRNEYLQMLRDSLTEIESKLAGLEEEINMLEKERAKLWKLRKKGN